MSIKIEYLEIDLEKKKRELQAITTVRFKIQIMYRLLQTYIKSVLGFFIPNTLVMVIAGTLIWLLTPNNIPEQWLKTWIPCGWAFFLVFGGFILWLLHSEPFHAPIPLWITTAICVGVILAIPYLFSPSNDPSILYYGYGFFTFMVVPLIFMVRRALFIKNGIKSLKRKVEFEENMKQKGFVKIVRHGYEYWGTPEQVKRYEEIEAALLNNFRGYDNRRFRKFLEELFRRMGYELVIDYGSYLIVEKNKEKTLVVGERWSENALVGNKEVRAVLGTLLGKAQRAIFIVTSDFTEYAYEQAKNSPIELWNRQRLAEWVEMVFLKPLEKKMLRFDG